MNIRILKSLGDARPQGPCRHFVIASILKRIKRPTVITGKAFWNFLSLYYGAKTGIQLPAADSEQHGFDLDSALESEWRTQKQSAGEDSQQDQEEEAYAPSEQSL